MQRDKLKSEGTRYLPEEDLQHVRKEDGATQSLIKSGGSAYSKEEVGDFNHNTYYNYKPTA